ncbi:MAG: YqeG family HAD IIIA-type phosphatase [Oscillospiraceae bacterium]|nr:YqeG family HAD IIIA-type phosphatase [Oscillospiraceae bacterium]
MRVSLSPDWRFDAYTDVTPDFLRDLGVKLLLCDLDYTLAPRSVARPDETLRRWIGKMEETGIRVMILSNNRRPVRVETFCRDLGITYVGHAGKPLRRGFRRAMSEAGVTERETAMLGDKLLTDALGGHLSGVWVLTVEPAGGARTVGQKLLHAMQAPFKRKGRTIQ